MTAESKCAPSEREQDANARMADNQQAQRILLALVSPPDSRHPVSREFLA